MNPVEQLIDVLTFEPCRLCKEHEGPLCRSCIEYIASDIESRCYICNKLSKQNRVCRVHSSALRRVWWAGMYKTELKDLIAAMKLGRSRAAARDLGMLLSTILPYLPPDTRIVPVSTAPARRLRRGYDHAHQIAKTVSSRTNLRLSTALVRTSNVDQIGRSRSQRINQMSGVFSVSGGFEGQTILLVDDIITTGATIESAAKTLRQAGARHVDAVVVARHLLK